MHWISAPGTSRGGGAADRHRGQPRAHGDPRRAELRLAHRAGVPLGGDRRRRTSARTGSASTRRAVRRDRWPPSTRSSRAIPGLFRNRGDLPERADRRGARRVQRRDRRAHLRRRPGDPARQGGRGAASSSRTSTASSSSTSSSRPTSRRSEIDVDLVKARAVRAEARRRAPSGGDHAGERRGRRHLPGRQGLRRARVQHAEVAQQPERRRRDAARYPRRADTSSCRTWPTCVSSRRRTPSRVSRSRARITVGANVEGRDLGSVVQELQQDLTAVELPARGPRRGAGRVRGAAGGPVPPASCSRPSP